MTTDYEAPLTTEDLQALVAYIERASEKVLTGTFPTTAVERARWEIRRRQEAEA